MHPIADRDTIDRLQDGPGDRRSISAFEQRAPILTDTFLTNERGKALGMNRISQVFGTTVGLVVGGLLVSLGGWRSIFWINTPIGIFGTMWSHYKLRELGTLDRGKKIDIVGNVTFAVSVLLLLADYS